MAYQDNVVKAGSDNAGNINNNDAGKVNNSGQHTGPIKYIPKNF